MRAFLIVLLLLPAGLADTVVLKSGLELHGALDPGSTEELANRPAQRLLEALFGEAEVGEGLLEERLQEAVDADCARDVQRGEDLGGDVVARVAAGVRDQPVVLLGDPEGLLRRQEEELLPGALPVGHVGHRRDEAPNQVASLQPGAELGTRRDATRQLSRHGVALLERGQRNGFREGRRRALFILFRRSPFDGLGRGGGELRCLGSGRLSRRLLAGTGEVEEVDPGRCGQQRHPDDHGEGPGARPSRVERSSGPLDHGSP